jgi:hypothetical protein
MKFTARREFKFDPELGARADAAIALRLFDEYCRRYSAQPPPRFFEIDRSPEHIDGLWHVPVEDRHQISRQLDIYAINQFKKPVWNRTKLGITYQRRDTFWLSYLALQKFDWWPLQGDLLYWVGYRYLVLDVNVPPECYWGQTGVWTGITVECIVPADGDAIPAFPEDKAQPAETKRNALAQGSP